MSSDSSDFNSFSPTHQLDGTLLRFLTGEELAELDRLLGAPTPDGVIATLPLSVLCAILHAHRTEIETKGGEPGGGGWGETQSLHVPENPGHIRIDTLDLPEHLLVQLLDAFATGHWQGEVCPEIIPAREWEGASAWFQDHFQALRDREVKLPHGWTIYALKYQLAQGPRGADALESFHAVQKLRYALQTL